MSGSSVWHFDSVYVPRKPKITLFPRLCVTTYILHRLFKYSDYTLILPYIGLSTNNRISTFSTLYANEYDERQIFEIYVQAIRLHNLANQMTSCPKYRSRNCYGRLILRHM